MPYDSDDASPRVILGQGLRRHPHSGELAWVVVDESERVLFIEPHRLAHRDCERCQGIWEAERDAFAELDPGEMRYALLTVDGSNFVVHAEDVPDESATS